MALAAVAIALAVALAATPRVATAEETPTPTATPSAESIWPEWDATPAGRQGAATPTPNRRAPRSPVATNWVLPLLPTVVPVAPQPSAFFVPRLITATAGLDDYGGSRLQGRVVDWRGNGMLGIAVRSATTQDERTEFTRGDGAYLFEGLTTGTYSVTVAGYEGMAAGPLPVDGRSIYIVEFLEAARPPTLAMTTTMTATVTATSRTPTPTAQASPAVTPTVAPPAGTTPAAGAGRTAPLPKQEGPLLAAADLDYLSRTLLTPFLLGVAGGYIIFLVGIFGAGLRR